MSPADDSILTTGAFALCERAEECTHTVVLQEGVRCFKPLVQPSAASVRLRDRFALGV